MTTAGPNAPGTMATEANGGTQNWTDPNNAKVSDDSAAIVFISTGTLRQSYALKASNFGFSIPTGATINGVSVSIERKSARSDADYYFIRDKEVRLMKAGVFSGDNKADTASNWPISDTVKSYGGVSDLWGTTLAYSDINDTGFGVELTVNLGKFKVGNTGYVDFISITVTYTEGGGGASAVPVIMNQYRQRRA